MSADAESGPPRLVPDLPLPPYTHIPGRTPHPLSDPRGHSFGAAPNRPDAPDPDHWQICRPYLYGLDLFNHGYYWEAHEIWEGLWHACGRAGENADFLKGLIKLAAAGVKVMEDKRRGIQTHARRAEALFRKIAAELGGEDPSFWGLSLHDLIQFASAIADQLPEVKDVAAGSGSAVFSRFLIPS
jgi:predicted metal-dependent hydrolase